ncbi:MAG TPA: holo-ACP synthase [Nitrosospira sp.]|nr:holo-ACP synthase [Nitrosospira sp.]
MIYGIGTDLVEPARIARLLEKYGERFAKRLLTDEEWPEYLGSGQPAMFLAKRFAAKEALAKAFGTGMRYPVSLSHIGITHDHLGKPYFTFHAALRELARNEGITRHHLSISDELNLACAFVILEK